MSISFSEQIRIFVEDGYPCNDLWGVDSQYCQDPREASEAGHLSQDQGKGQPREQARVFQAEEWWVP